MHEDSITRITYGPREEPPEPICGDINLDVTHTRETCPCTQPYGHMATAPELGHECDCGAAWGWRQVSRDERRARLLPAVAKLTRSPAFRAACGPEATIIMVLPDDTVTYVVDRLAQAESPAVLVLPGDAGMRIVKLTEVNL
jgi:hypothetical protein